MTVMCSVLTEAVNNGGMKTRWNACYACHNALKNSCFVSHFEQSMVRKVHVHVFISSHLTNHNTIVFTVQ